MDRPFQWAIEHPNRRSYAKVMTPGSWLFNLSLWGCKLNDGSSSRVTFWNFGVLSLILIINRPFFPHFVFNLAWIGIASTSLLKDNYHHSSYCIYSLFYFRHLIEYLFTVSLLSLQNVCYYDSISAISFCSHINTDQLMVIITTLM